MVNEFSVEIGHNAYLMKRLSHSELPLTYHIQLIFQYRNIILRMGVVNGNWSFLNSMNIPFKFGLLEKQLANEIMKNENSPSESNIANTVSFSLGAEQLILL